MFRRFAPEEYAKDKIMLPYKRALNIDELNANHQQVSVHKYGFFLCRRGEARIQLGSEVYQISRNHLCIYTPNTFFRVLEKSSDLDGILEENRVDAYYPVVSSISIRKRLQIRNAPCVEVSEAQADSIVRLVDRVREEEAAPVVSEKATEEIHANYLQYLRYALCLKVLEVYFSNTPVDSMPQDREDTILNRFIVSVYEHCHQQRTVQYYADEQHLSPYYFSSIIRNRSGKSAMQWIENVTMTFAQQYLACSEMSIKEIADRLNFPDQSTFGRYFKHREGCSPSLFRNSRSGK